MKESLSIKKSVHQLNKFKIISTSELGQTHSFIFSYIYVYKVIM